MFVAQADTLATTKKLLLGEPFVECFWKLEVRKLLNLLDFSISNYPNYESHMPPPARFLDTTTGEKKSTASSPRIRTNTKLKREAFQINV